MRLQMLCMAVLVQLLTTCDLHDENDPLSPLTLMDSLTFQTGMMVKEKYAGTLINAEHELQYYFANTMTDKMIKFYDANGNWINSISLATIFKTEGAIDHIEVLSNDSILVLGSHSNTLYLMNRKGKINKKVVLGNSGKNKQKLLYSKPSVHGNDLLIASYWVDESESMDSLEKTNELMFHKKINSDLFELPTHIKLENILSDGSLVSEEFNININLFKNREYYVGEPRYFKVISNRLFCWSVYSDILLVVNVQNLEIESKVKIQSDFTKVGVNRLKIDRDFLDKRSYLINQNFKSGGGLIIGIYFNSTRGHYYVTVLNKIEIQAFNEQGYRTWSLLIYDKDFNKIGETLFSNNLYKNFIIPSKQGIMIQKNSRPTAYKEQRLVFHEFSYE